MRPRDAAARGGAVAAACVACCAPPIVATLGVTAGIAVTAGVFLGLAAAVAVVLVGLGQVVRQRRPASGPGPDHPVAVVAPTRRATADG